MDRVRTHGKTSVALPSRLRDADLDKSVTVSKPEFKEFLFITEATEQGRDAAVDASTAPAPEGSAELEEEGKAQRLEQESKERKRQADERRQQEDERVRQAGSSCEACGDAGSAPSKPNPDLTHATKVRWDYTDGTFPMYSSCRGCTQFENDPDEGSGNVHEREGRRAEIEGAARVRERRGQVATDRADLTDRRPDAAGQGRGRELLQGHPRPHEHGRPQRAPQSWQT